MCNWRCLWVACSTTAPFRKVRQVFGVPYHDWFILFNVCDGPQHVSVHPLIAWNYKWSGIMLQRLPKLTWQFGLQTWFSNRKGPHSNRLPTGPNIPGLDSITEMLVWSSKIKSRDIELDVVRIGLPIDIRQRALRPMEVFFWSKETFSNLTELSSEYKR